MPGAQSNFVCVQCGETIALNGSYNYCQQCHSFPLCADCAAEHYADCEETEAASNFTNYGSITVAAGGSVRVGTVPQQ